MKSPSHLAGLLSWFSERFPVVNFLAGAIMFEMIAFVARDFAHTRPDSIFMNIFGIAALVSFFLMLRVFDEHKDFELDSKNHPNRALQRGLISLRDLKLIGWICLVIQISYVWLSARDMGAWVSYFLMLGWSLLMLKEFFIPEELKRMPMVYAVTHMLVVPLVVFWILTALVGGFPENHALLGLTALPFFSGMIYEFSRKSRGDDEKKSLESYTAIYGKVRILIFSLACFFMMAALTWILCEKLDQSPKIIGGGVAGSAVFFILGWMSFLKNPTEKTRKTNEGLGGASVLLCYLLILFSAIHR